MTETHATDSDRTRLARTRLGDLIDRGRASAQTVIDQIQRDVPTDRIVRGVQMAFQPAANAGRPLAVTFDGHDAPALLHQHAVGQVAERAGVPAAYVRRLAGHDWGRGLLAADLSTIFLKDQALSDGRYLVRALGRGDGSREIRGVLSDRYRRLDSRPIFDAFAGACQQHGVLPYDGFALETRIAVHAIRPELYEPVPGEVLAFGLSFSNSDYGDGALEVRAFTLRLVCVNGMIGTDDVLRRVHLGRRLADDVAFSAETHRLDSETMASAVGDVVRDRVGRIDDYLDAVRAAAAHQIDAPTIRSFLRKRTTLDLAGQVTDAFNGADVEMMPAGNTAWRLSNAISWVAGKQEDPYRRLELQRLAGEATALALPAAA